MVWYRKPGLNRFRNGRLVREAAWLQEMVVPVVTPGDEPDVGGWFMASFTLTPIYETGSSTDDVFVGAVYVDAASSLRCSAYLGSTKSGTNVTLKVSETYYAAGQTVASTTATFSTSAGLATVTDDANFSVAAGTLLFFYLSCASAECSWQCPAIILVRQ